MKTFPTSLVFILISVTTALAQTWTGAENNDWNNPLNWNPKVVPDANSEVAIFPAGRNYPVLPGDVEVKALNMTSNSVLDFAGHRLKVNGGINMYQTVLISSGSGPIRIEITVGTMNIREIVVENDLHVTVSGNAQLVENPSENSSVFKGNVTYLLDTPFAVYLTPFGDAPYKKDLTIERTTPGATAMFHFGSADFVAVEGNFLYKSRVGGNLIIGHKVYKSNFKGDFSIEIEGNGRFPFVELYNIDNEVSTQEGNIQISDPGQITMSKCTLKVQNINISRAKNISADFLDNRFTVKGQFYYNDVPYYEKQSQSPIAGVIKFSGNTVNGNTHFKLDGTSSLKEAGSEARPNRFNGDLLIDANNYWSVDMSYASGISYYGGNVTIRKTYPGSLNLFMGQGTSIIEGNLSIFCNTYADVILGSSEPSTRIDVKGKLTIEFENLRGGGLHMHSLRNRTNGGYIRVKNPTYFHFQGDTLVVDKIEIIDFRAPENEFKLINSQISTKNGSFFNFIPGFQTGFMPENYVYIKYGGNSLYGPVEITNGGSEVFSDTHKDFGPNYYHGDVTYQTSGDGKIIIGNGAPVYYAGSVYFKSSSGISLIENRIHFIGSNHATIYHRLDGELVIPGFTLNKEGGARLVLYQPLRITRNVEFIRGYVEAHNVTPLIFMSAATHTGASDSSHVIGAVQHIGDDTFTFPVGNGERLMPATLYKYPSRVESTFQILLRKALSVLKKPVAPYVEYRVNYINRSPDLDGFDRNARENSLASVSGVGYWEIKRIGGDDKRFVSLGFDLPDAFDEEDSRLVLAHWNGSKWILRGQGAVAGEYGRNWVNSAEQLSDFGPFTIGALAAPQSERLATGDKNLEVPMLNSKGEILPVVYPNPASRFLRLDFDQEIISSVRVFSLTGVELPVTAKTLDARLSELDLGGVGDGIYLLRLETKEGQSLIRRFIISRQEK